jgi:putative membrane protein (TIGR04086 family)
MNFSLSIKALLSGALFIIIASLLMKIIYVFLYPFLSQLHEAVRYIIAVPVFFAIIFVGGYITAGIARRKTLLHSFLAGLLTTLVMLIVALQSSEGITLMNYVVYVAIIIIASAGGYFWKYRALSASSRT